MCQLFCGSGQQMGAIKQEKMKFKHSLDVATLWLTAQCSKKQTKLRQSTICRS